MEKKKYCKMCGKEIKDITDCHNGEPVVHGDVCSECNSHVQGVRLAYVLAESKHMGILLTKEGSKYGVALVKPQKGELFSLEELQSYVEGYIEIVHCALDSNFLVIINDEGLINNLYPNELTRLFTNYPQTLRGNILVIPQDMVE